MEPTNDRTCGTCHATFPSRLHRTRHEVDAHPLPEPEPVAFCSYCGKGFSAKGKARTHELIACSQNEDYNR